MEWAEAYHDGALVAHQHYLLNTSIELDGDVAHVETYWIAAGTRPDLRHTLEGGRYVDRFEHRDDAWRISARRLVVEWTNDPAALEGLWALGGRPAQDRTDVSYLRPLTVDRADRISAPLKSSPAS